MLRSIQASLRRGTYRPSSAHLVRLGYSTDSTPERKVVRSLSWAPSVESASVALLMKLNSLIHRPSLYDIASTPGGAADVGHIKTRS